MTIQFGITGPYLTLLSGANAGIEALWQAVTLLTTAQCERVLVLGVETFQECAELLRHRPLAPGSPPGRNGNLSYPGTTCQPGRCALSCCVWGHGLPSLSAGRAGQAVAGVYLCTPTATVGNVQRHPWRRSGRMWPCQPVHERCGICLACCPFDRVAARCSLPGCQETSCSSRIGGTPGLLRWPGSQARKLSK